MPRKKKDDEIIEDAANIEDAAVTEDAETASEITDAEDFGDADNADVEYKLTADDADESTDDIPDTVDSEPSAAIKESDAEPESETAHAAKPPQPAAEKRKPSPPRKKTIFDLKLNELDRDLSEEQRDEWNAIYASFRSKSVLSGTVVGVDENTFEVTNRETREREKKSMYTLIVIGYRVKIIIPETELWMPGEERPSHTIRSMAGAKIDFVILEVDREGECAIASRRLAIMDKRRHFARTERHEGEMLTCSVTMVGAKRCGVECGGYDIQLSQRELSYTAIADLREKYRTGQELKCRLKSYDAKTGELSISVKEVNPNPFVGADTRHPIRSRRQAVISGKYAGGVFCTLPDETVCLCLYSAQHSDGDFRIGDGVILAVTHYDYGRQLIFGRILAKW